MKKLYIFLLLFLIMLTGCNKEQNVTSNIDREKYVDKIWIVKNWNSQEEYGYVSFIISKIDSKQIEGYFDINEIIMPDIRIFANEKNESQTDNYYGRFKGTINEKIATCTFEWKKVDIAGRMEIEFRENDLKVKFVPEKNTKNNEVRMDGVYVFKTYNLKDEEGNNFVFKDKISPVKVKRWGDVDFVSRFRTGSKHSVLLIYLTDKSGNIIYDFSYPNYFPTDSYVYDYTFTDLNKDGFEDLILILSCGGDSRQARVYFQNSKNGFEDNAVLFDRLNMEGSFHNKNVESVINFMEKYENNKKY